MAVIDELLRNNETYASNFDKASLPMPPGKHIAVVTCMDARIEPGRALGIEEGDAHVIRNAGGRISEAARSLAISQELLGTREVAIIHHVDCGMLTFTDDSLRQQLKENLGADTNHVAFLPFADVEQSVRDDLELYRQIPYLRQDIPVRGFVFDVKSGRVKEVS